MTAIDRLSVARTLDISAGDDQHLHDELWSAFQSGLNATFQQLVEARTASDWRQAAHRLRGLAATYGALELAALAMTAYRAMAGDIMLLSQIRERIAALQEPFLRSDEAR